MKPVSLYAAVTGLSLWVHGSVLASMCLPHPIRFAHYEFGLVYSSGYGGIDDDVQKELARRSGCKFEVSVRPRARTWVDLELGGADMAGSGIQTPERDRFVWFFHYIFENNVIVLGPKVPADVHSAEQFLAHPALTLGGVRSFRYSPYYDSFVDQLIAAKRHTDVADPDGLYRMFDVQRFDAFITNPILYLYYVKQLNLPAPKRVETWDRAGPSPSGLVLSKRSFTEDQARQWGALIQGMLTDGTIQKIVIKHLGRELGLRTVYHPPKK